MRFPAHCSLFTQKMHVNVCNRLWLFEFLNQTVVTLQTKMGVPFDEAPILCDDYFFRSLVAVPFLPAAFSVALYPNFPKAFMIFSGLFFSAS